MVRRLGVPAAGAKLDEFRLGLAFMASSPRGVVELDFEAEESAILGAVGESRVDLLVEDTGDPDQLAQRLADIGGMPVVHLSCHGLNNWHARPGGPGVPVLLMEDDVGEGCQVTAADLAGLLPGGLRLVFVSACLTATGADVEGHLPPGDGHKGGPGLGGGLVAHSLATGLVAAGLPAVIGWDGSVADRSATVFAERLYQGLARRADLAQAVGDARRALLTSDDPVVRQGWHLARLWLGPGGGGPVVAGSRRRSLIPATQGTKIFLDRKSQVPVAAAEMFVGRRAELQASLRTLRSGERAGVLLHGQGRLGKSSLAARIADRCPHYAIAVVFGDYTAMGIAYAVAAAVQADPAARELIKAGLPQVRQQPETIGQVLTDLLAGPCAQGTGNGGRPLLLIIDDLEQILIPDPAGPHQVTPALAGVLAEVLTAFDPARTDSRLLITSRYTFTLAGLENRLEPVQLTPMSSVAQVKLQRRQQALTPADRLVERSDLADRAMEVSKGNPGLQDLIGLRLVYSGQVTKEHAEAAVADMESYLHQGGLPGDAQVREFVENLALDALLEEAGSAGRALLRAATLFDLPVPETVIDELARNVGGSPARLCGLGLLTRYPDLYDPARPALRADPLATGRIEPLTVGEQKALATVSLPLLFGAWGGTIQAHHRDLMLDLELTQLALHAEDPEVAATCGRGAVAGLRTGPAADAYKFGSEVIELLDRRAYPVPLGVLRAVADAALTSGDGQAGGTLLDRAVRLVATEDQGDTNSLSHARVMVEQARHLVTRGEFDQADQLVQQAYRLFTAAESEQDAAVAQGVIADIAFQQGEYDEAMRIRREVTLPIYERLGDLRSVAVTWGQIAEIAYQRGEYDEALRIHREIELPVYERLGDVRGAALAWGQIADIVYERGEYDEALRIHREVTLPVYERLGEARSVAITWGQIAEIAYRRGEYDEALRIRREIELPVYERLSDARSAAITWGQIADIAYERGEYDEALRIYHEITLPAFERLGDTRSAGVAWGRIADIAYQRGDLAEAAELQRKRLEVNRQLGDADGIAVASWDLARIDLTREDYQAALPRLIESFQISSRLQRPDGVALAGRELGRLLIAAGQTKLARQILGEALAAATKIGWSDDARQISELLTSHPAASEEL